MSGGVGDAGSGPASGSASGPAGVDDPRGWADFIERMIGAGELGLVDRVRVLAETASTQDAARAAAGGRPGLVVLAHRQVGGRGRLGRAWSDGGGRSLSMTVVVDGSIGVERVSLGAGLGVCEGAASLLGGSGGGLGLRWPNDVVEREGGRKLAGVLIERAGPLALIGVGLNVSQGAEDWAGPLRGVGVSLRELGCETGRIDAACAVLRGLERWLGADDAAVARAWAERDTLTGRRAVFECAGRRVAGVVERVEPTGGLVVRTDAGVQEVLASATSSLVG